MSSLVSLLLTHAEAVTPDQAAKTLGEWIDQLDISKSGELWAPRGPGKKCPIMGHCFISCIAASRTLTAGTIRIGDIGTAEDVLGSGLPTPFKLPW